MPVTEAPIGPTVANLQLATQGDLQRVPSTLDSAGFGAWLQLHPSTGSWLPRPAQEVGIGHVHENAVPRSQEPGTGHRSSPEGPGHGSGILGTNKAFASFQALAYTNAHVPLKEELEDTGLPYKGRPRQAGGGSSKRHSGPHRQQVQMGLADCP